MHRLGTMGMTCVAVLALAACSAGGREAGGSRTEQPPTTPATPTSATPTSTGPTAPPTASSTPNGFEVGPATLGTAVDRLHRAESGHFTVRAFGSGDTAFLPTVDGAWSYRGPRSSSTFRFLLPGRGTVVLNTIGVRDRVYSQPLVSGSRFTRTCWVRLPAALSHGGTFPAPVLAVEGARSDGTRETMLLADVIQAIGFVQAVRASRSALGATRVTVGFRVEIGELTGWGVLASDVLEALDEVRRTKPLTRLRTTLEAVPDAAWDIAFVDVGEPVRVTEPPSSSLVEGDDFSPCTRDV